MKQRITAEQLQELTREQERRLEEWWKPEKYDLFMYGGLKHPLQVKELNKQGRIWTGRTDPWVKSKGGKVYYDGGIPLLNIGQCIKLLNDKTNEQDINYNDTGCFWKVCYGINVPGENTRETSADELIDALWQAVKEAL